jgi:hypothetical protein
MYMLHTTGENIRSGGKTQAKEKQLLKTRNQVELGHERSLKEVLVRGRGGHFALAIL